MIVRNYINYITHDSYKQTMSQVPQNNISLPFKNVLLNFLGLLQFLGGGGGDGRVFFLLKIPESKKDINLMWFYFIMT